MGGLVSDVVRRMEREVVDRAGVVMTVRKEKEKSFEQRVDIDIRQLPWTHTRGSDF